MHRLSGFRILPILLLLAALPARLPAAASGSLAAQVDALIAAGAKGHAVSPAADDAEFLRRVHLDFAGDLPTPEQVRKFLADTSANKRTALINELINGPGFPTRLAEAFNIMLMERRPKDKNWSDYLAASFQANKPWDQIVREVLNPDFKDEKLRGAGYFITQRLDKVGQQDTDYPGLTRDVGRMFMGVDLQCAQCHRHLTVKQYKQADFSGLFMVYQNLKPQAPAGDFKTKWVSEGLITAKYEFASVFTEKKEQVAPRVPFSEEIAIPAYAKEELWIEPPDRKTRNLGTPRFSPLKEIAGRLASPENPYFARNIANRVWFLLMGRGLVEPLDLSHQENPPSHPELLDLLAAELTAHQFDLKWLIRELALTETYQRSSVLPAGGTPAPEDRFATAKERPLSWEQLVRAFLTATGEAGRVAKGRPKDAAKDAKFYTRAEFDKAFEAAFANAAKEPELEVSPSLKIALFLRNSDLVLWALEPRADNLVDRLAKIPEAGRLVEELYLAALTRPPDADERKLATAYLAKHTADKPRAVGHLAWSLLSSIEFFVNH